MQPGDLIYVSTRPRRERPGARETGEVRMALVMVRAGERVGVAVRLVQDFGGPDDPDAATMATRPAAAMADAACATAPAGTPALPVTRRGRGRPPGSRSKRPALIPASDANASIAGAPVADTGKFAAGRDSAGDELPGSCPAP